MIDGGTIATWLANNLAGFLPVKTVRSYQQGVKFSLGRDTATLPPGIHWYVPFFQAVEVENTAEETIDLPTQTVTTKDGIPVTFSANVVYLTHDARRRYCGLMNFDRSIGNVARNHLARRVRRLSWDELVQRQSWLERSLARTLTTRAKRYGVEILEVGITDFTRAKPLRLYGDSIPLL